MERVYQLIMKLFESYRIVFWYDNNVDLETYLMVSSLELPGIEKSEIANNEFGLKYRILIDEPQQKFFLYQRKAKPSLEDNWLADLLLANVELKIDEASLWVEELGLDKSLTATVKDCQEFFRSNKRVEALKKMLEPNMSVNGLKQRMIAVCTGAVAKWEDIILNLLDESALGKEDKQHLLRKVKLDGFFWSQVKTIFGYNTENPSIKDFALEMFSVAFDETVRQDLSFSTECIYLLKQWKDSTRYQASFKMFSRLSSQALDIKNKIADLDLSYFEDVDYFEEFELKILSELKKGISKDTYSSEEVERLIPKRRVSCWFRNYENEYLCLEQAVRFISIAKGDNFRVENYEMAETYMLYVNSWYKLDLHYRKFIYHYTTSKHPTLLQQIYEKIENFYCNSFLHKLNTGWSVLIADTKPWSIPSVSQQKSFWELYVKPFIDANKKIFVIVSDGLRYEAAYELMSMIRQEDRYEAEIDNMLGMLPSYTQLGMAALLPHDSLSLSEDSSGTVRVDGMIASGKESRSKIINKALSGGALLMQSDELMQKPADECKKLFRDYDVIYIYHNRIDMTGDKRDSETKVFEAVKTALNELVDTTRKLASGNANNIIITGDHGFIYQHRELEQSDYVSEEDIGGEILYKDRRFVLGKNLKTDDKMFHFSSSLLGLSGSVEVAIPKGYQRLRKSGSGSRYVHGGTALQEITLPVLRVNKKRTSDVSFVGVDVISSGGRIITTGQLTVTLYQTDPITDKRQPVSLRIGIYNNRNELISEQKNTLFDFTSHKPRERELNCSLLLSQKAEEANNQEVFLKLEKPIPGTNKYELYRSETYRLRRSITSDFDF